MPDLASLETLLAVVRTGSLNAAAHEFGITQQATSARMRALESLLGVSLLTRTPTGTSLTSTGTLVAEWADKLLTLAGEIDVGLAALRHEQRLRLRVAASLTIAEHLLPQWLVSFGAAATDPAALAEHPKVSFTATNTEHVCEMVRAGEVDLGFVEGPEVARGVHSRVIAHDGLVLVVPPGHPWAQRTAAVTPAELARTALVTREPGSGTREVFDRELRRALGPEIMAAAPALELSSTSAIRSAVIAGAGPAVVSALAFRDDIGRRLVTVALSGLDLRRDLRAVWIGGPDPQAGPARDFLTHVARSAAQPPR